ncbi:MAG: hypothetical protein ACTSRZ_15135 [Promethearchaeota archaeon]
MERDPKFLIVQKNRYVSGIDQPNIILFNPEGELILRSNEVLIDKFEGSVEILRFPEYFELLSYEKYNWFIYITSERLICANNLDKIKNAYELMDHIDNFGVLAVIEPYGSVSLDDLFAMVRKRKKEVKEYIMAFQIAYTRLSSVSVFKVEDKKGEPIMGGVELWYKDSESATDSQIMIYPKNTFEDPYKHALTIHTEALKQKLACTNKKKEIDPNFGEGKYVKWKSTLERLIKKPDLLAQGSGDLNIQSWDPIIFQSHPIQWLCDAFPATLKPDDKTHTSF